MLNSTVGVRSTSRTEGKQIWNEARKLFNIKLELSSVLKKVEDGGYPNGTDIVAIYKSVENDLGNILGELNSLGYSTSFPNIKGNSHTTASHPTALAVVSPIMSSGRSTSVPLSAVTPLPVAVSHTMVSPIPPTPHQLPFLPSSTLSLLPPPRRWTWRWWM
ncbi:unnamed protein product [Prunus armeniaca]|uniref:Uncharacterized protein n=1 Tax=Prunus armeniaca TaxID=36596 RepID=A0A6J5XSB9_PRUAR|nr:unnamed protein product [Prunus armeniaca]